MRRRRARDRNSGLAVRRQPGGWPGRLAGFPRPMPCGRPVPGCERGRVDGPAARTEVARTEVAQSGVARSGVARSGVARSGVVRAEVVRTEVDPALTASIRWRATARHRTPPEAEVPRRSSPRRLEQPVSGVACRPDSATWFGAVCVVVWAETGWIVHRCNARNESDWPPRSASACRNSAGQCGRCLAGSGAKLAVWAVFASQWERRPDGKDAPKTSTMIASAARCVA
ncbi:hypothetical protein BJY18_006926 [Amycolatopsis jiangsuensis]|uniref:Uncharacterized protein n=1 Tax=Amycolatopsis jiangsuensis TaxID=1181879 RepID=A0A840J302_9PSEU|nr:hypothetical protein [Amycolatopsis jiangsuensis]